MKKLSLGALVAAGLLMGGLTAGSASAADLGGNCCADLEERIAELEATTARKGNRKVSLTISGWVAEQVMGWDDGSERNVYVGGLGTTLATNVKFTGQATISPGWYAGYVLHLEADGSDSLTQNQNVAQGPGLYGFLANNGSLISGTGGQNNYVSALQSFWFVKSDHLGKVSIGLQSQASDNTAILVDGSGSLVPANWVAFDVNAFGVRLNNGNLSALGWGLNSCRGMGGSWGDCNGLPQDSVRYDSPTFAGFSVSASWGQDHFWDVAARYAGEWNGIKFAAAAAYNEVTDGNYNNICTALGAAGGAINGSAALGTCSKANGGFIPSGSKERYAQVGAYVEHVPTGLFAYGAFGWVDQDGSTLDYALINSAQPGGSNGNCTGVNNNADCAFTATKTWYGKIGLREHWTHLGHTVLYGEYERVQDPYSLQALAVAGNGNFGGDSHMWGVGAVQEIDAAAMSVWLKYRDFSADGAVCTVTDAGGCIASSDFSDMKELTFGGLINF